MGDTKIKLSLWVSNADEIRNALWENGYTLNRDITEQDVDKIGLRLIEAVSHLLSQINAVYDETIIDFFGDELKEIEVDNE